MVMRRFILKRCLDLCLSVILLVLLSPIFFIVFFLIKLQNPGPVIFRQKRVGLNGKIFNLLKFRSMIWDPNEKGPYFTKENDARIYPLGKYLRKYSIDELPQLINVLRGEMSLIGPRPELIIQKALYTKEEWEIRHSVRPGITGLAQVHGRSFIKPGRRKYFDLKYAKEYSLKIDIFIIIKTFILFFRKSDSI